MNYYKQQLPHGKTKISINIPEKLLEALDNERTNPKLTRSNWITSAIMEKLSLKEKRNLECL